MVLLPYLWLVCLFLAPFVIVLKISLSQTTLAQPPYSPVFDLSAGWAGLVEFGRQLSLDSFGLLFTDLIYLLSYLKSLQVAAISTIILLLIGYPFAYGIARAPRGWQPPLVMAVVLPFWTSFLVRVYAWINILQRDGLLNDVLMRLHIVDAPVSWLSSDTAIYIGVVYSYLPFMVLPLYAALEKMDETLLEAAADLGCPRWKTFWLVVVPLSLPGAAAFPSCPKTRRTGAPSAVRTAVRLRRSRMASPRARAMIRRAERLTATGRAHAVAAVSVDVLMSAPVLR